MFELVGIVFFVLAAIDYVLKTGNGDIHMLLALVFIITSMAIKTHTESVKISNYISHSHKKDADNADKSDEVIVKENE